MKKMIRDLKIVKFEGPCKRVPVEVVLEAIKLMITGKITWPSGITVDLLKVCKIEFIIRLTKVTNDMLNGKKMPKSWKRVICYQYTKEREI